MWSFKGCYKMCARVLCACTSNFRICDCITIYHSVSHICFTKHVLGFVVVVFLVCLLFFSPYACIYCVLLKDAPHGGHLWHFTYSLPHWFFRFPTTSKEMYPCPYQFKMCVEHFFKTYFKVWNCWVRIWNCIFLDNCSHVSLSRYLLYITNLEKKNISEKER